MIPTGALARSKDGVARSAGDVVVGDDQFDVEAEVCPSYVGVVGLAVALVKNGVRVNVHRASMTLFLIAVSMGRWFMVLSLGCNRSQAC